MGIKTFLHRLRDDTSGNAMLLVAMGAPVLFGSAGLGVDMAQYYLWKRELQYAVDQSALAAAWARGNGDTSTNADGADAAFKKRSRQEFYSNLSRTKNYLLSHRIKLIEYEDIDDNAVEAEASATAELPFTKLVLGDGMTVAVKAQAIWETTKQFTACLYSLDTESPKTMWFSGTYTVDAACGVGARSTAGNAIATDGNSGAQDINWVIAGGGIEDSAGAFVNAEVVENYDNMVDPWEDLTPPDDTTSRDNPGTVDGCSGNERLANWQADETITEEITYLYYKGANKSSAKAADPIEYSGAGALEGTTTTYPTIVDSDFNEEPTDKTSTTVGSLSQVAGSGPDKIYAEPTTTTTYVYTNKEYLDNDFTLQPGTYENGMNIKCNAVMESGVYVISGGTLSLTGGKTLIGEGVMFVLENGVSINFEGGAKVYLTPMTANEILAYTNITDAEHAAKLENMLIFEHPDSPGSANNKITGGSHFDLNGTIYMPNSDLALAGSMNASAECLMVATGKLSISGGADLETLCPAGKTHDIVVGEGRTRVRLVL
ncbi:pilus assembly protein [Qipengyuania sp. 1NDH17]|uniref:Pilus assembly protein n=1 Tax=Qipengyuania polymorpha TaxID=2867234 RepID=A0ABS7J1T0_9SPHN|nr:TadE/TadG family type IV pilus assembly protein [Qipengyuania polymorpha]MBX7457403.1 pilus assembly protein [Qipengyuania polymorpha]